MVWTLFFLFFVATSIPASPLPQQFPPSTTSLDPSSSIPNSPPSIPSSSSSYAPRYHATRARIKRKFHTLYNRTRAAIKRHKPGLVDFAVSVPVSLVVGAAVTVATGGDVILGAAAGGAAGNILGNEAKFAVKSKMRTGHYFHRPRNAAEFKQSFEKHLLSDTIQGGLGLAGGALGGVVAERFIGGPATHAGAAALAANAGTRVGVRVGERAMVAGGADAVGAAVASETFNKVSEKTVETGVEHSFKESSVFVGNTVNPNSKKNKEKKGQQGQQQPRRPWWRRPPTTTTTTTTVMTV